MKSQASTGCARFLTVVTLRRARSLIAAAGGLTTLLRTARVEREMRGRTTDGNAGAGRTNADTAASPCQRAIASSPPRGDSSERGRGRARKSGASGSICGKGGAGGQMIISSKLMSAEC